MLERNEFIGVLLLFFVLLVTTLVLPIIPTCLNLSLIIDNEHKIYYYRGLSEFKNTSGFLTGTIQSAQDVYMDWIRYFNEDLLSDLKI